MLALFVLVMGGIYVGAFTPTEAAGIGALVFSLYKRTMTWKHFIPSLVCFWTDGPSWSLLFR
jgi:TRAP-type C4-dicarboxylate transport system permease large subunit